MPGGIVVTASGIPYEDMRPEQVTFMDLNGNFYGDFMPSSEWRMHYDLYKRHPQDELYEIHWEPLFCFCPTTIAPHPNPPQKQMGPAI